MLEFLTQSSWANQIGWVLVHSLWQFALVALVAVGLQRALGRCSATARYLALLAAMFVMAALPVVTWFSPWSTDTPVVVAKAGPVVQPPHVPLAKRVSRPERADDTVTMTAMPTESPPELAAKPRSDPHRMQQAPTGMAAWLSLVQRRVQAWLPEIVLLWLTGVLLAALRPLFSWYTVRHLRTVGVSPVGDRVHNVVERTAKRLRLARAVEVLQSTLVKTPVVAGYFRPAVLLPLCVVTGLPEAQLELILAHELAHIRRHDYLVNLLQTLVETLFFYHPAVWWLSRQIRNERENCCDDVAMATVASRADYGRALLAIEELRASSPALSLAAHGGSLLARIRRIAGCEPTPRIAGGGSILCVILGSMALLAAVAWATAPSAEKTDQTSKPISMSAEEFGRLPLQEQRDLLVRVFQRRLEHSQNLFCESQERWAVHENQGGKPGRLMQDRSRGRRVIKNWRLGDSVRMDGEFYQDADATIPVSVSFHVINAEEGIARNATTWPDGKYRPQGQVQYPVYDNSSYYVYWFDRKTPRPDQFLGEPLFPYLIARKDEFEIKSPVEGNKVELSIPWQPEWARRPGGKRRYILDPQKGFLPIRCDSRFDDVKTNEKPQWRVEKFVVEDAKLVGDVWMPTRLSNTTIASSVPEIISTRRISVPRIEQGTVKPADLFVPFTKGMQVSDTIEGVTYTADVQGNATDVKDAPNWKGDPPKGWQRGQVAEGSSLASRIPAAERKRLIEEREAKSKAIDEGLKVLRAHPPATQEQRIDAALKILRAYRITEREDDWATAIHELVTIGKPAVPRLIEELDRTDSDKTLRAMGFVLRSIGDPRAVPSLIRAIPRLIQRGGDYGLTVKDDPALLTFMWMNDCSHVENDKKELRMNGLVLFSYERPIREIMSALQKLTGQSLGWRELDSAAMKADGIIQLRRQRTLFLDHARKWVDWWSHNWKPYVSEEADAQLDRTKHSIEQFAERVAYMPQPSLPTEIPTGPFVELGEGMLYQQFEPYLNLDVGRAIPRPEELLNNSPKDHPSPELLAWARQKGVDLLRIEIKRPGDSKTYYGYQPVGMKVWKIDNERLQNLEKELQQNKTLALPPLWEGPISSVDQQEGDIAEEKAATFLFITREGTCGTMRVRSGLLHEFVQGAIAMGPAVFEYRHIYTSEPEQSSANPAKSPPVLLSAIGKAVDSAGKPVADAWKPGQMLGFRVINARTKEPLPGVNLHLQFSGKGINFQDIKIQHTDAQGRSEIRLPDLKPDAVRVYTSKPGFVPLRVFWGSDNEPTAPPIIPKSVTVPMEPGTVWGGVIQNEKGESIPNVKVNVRYWESGSDPNPYLRVNIDDDIAGVTTDKDGHWQMNILPARLHDDGPRLFLTHPDYVSDHLQRGYTPVPVTDRPSYEALCNQTAVMVMRKGVTIEGRVTDEAGKPVAGAFICNEYDCYDPDPLRITATADAEGSFHLSGLSHRNNYRDYFFTVKAVGYAPVFVEVGDAHSGAPVDIKLTRGQAMQGQVFDENGKPIKGASIKLDHWMGRPRQFYLKTTTDAAGKFRINDAPLERTEYDIEKSGYIAVRKPLPPSSNDYRITLRAPLWVAGSIVDSETNRPLAKCRLIKGWDFEDGRNPQWETAIGFPAKEVVNGRYEFKFTQEHGTRIRAEADGYMPAVSRLFKPGDTDNGHVTYDFRLRKAAPRSRTVLGLDDKPLAGAEVFIATQQFNVKDRKPGPPVGEKRRMVITDEEGRFEFPPAVEPFYLIVLHDEGHIVLTEKQVAVMPTIRIQPWTSQNQTFSAERRPPTYAEKSSAADAKHTLTVRAVDPDGKPVEGAVVAEETSFRAGYNYVGPNEPAWTYFHSAVSDGNGMARIGDAYNRCVVARHIERKLVGVRSISPEQIGGADAVTLTMQPQCSVSGRLTSKELEAHGRKLTWTNVYIYLNDGIGRPMYCASNKGEYHFYLPPGTYKLDAYGTDVQHAWKTITVKPGQEEIEVEPIDLPPTGLVLLEGKPAPELRGITAWKNGGPVKLSDLRGRAVILAFTPKWNGEASIMPRLLPLYEKYHDQGLTIIEIRLDMDLALGVKSKADLDEQIARVAKPFWKGQDIPVPIALVLIPVLPPKNSKGTGAAVIEDYGANVPSAVLIDRQGRVVGRFDPRSNRDDAARDAVLEKVLQEKPGEQPTPAATMETSPSAQSQPAAPSEPLPTLLTALGRVVDPAGKPVAGATVHLREWSTYRISAEPYKRNPNDILATTQTDAQGAFRFEKVPAKPLSDQWLKQIPWDVVVVARPYAIAWRHLDAAQQSKPLTINLAPEAKLSGRVIDQHGEPVQNAEVRISGIQPLGSDAHCSAYAAPDVLDLQQSRLMHVFRTDTDGQVTIEGLPSDLLMQLSIHHDAFRSDSTFVATTDQPQPDMEIPNYEIGKPKKTKQIKVGCRRFTVTLEPPLPRLIGRVLAGDTKKPLPGARITGWGVPDALTDQNGQFVVREARQSQCHAIINAPEGSDYLGRLVFIDVPRDKQETHVDIELPRGEVVSGIIVDDAGQGVAGVSVMFDSGKGLMISVDTAERVMAGYQKTGRDGRFRIGVPSGKGKLLICGPVSGYALPDWHESDVSEFRREINVVTGQAIPEVKFTVQRMAIAKEARPAKHRDDWLTKARKTVIKTIDGNVVDPDGKPVTGAEVGLDRWFRNSGGEFHPVKTDQDGHFSLQVKPYGLSEEFIVAIHKERKLRGHLQLSLKPQEATLKAPVEIHLVSTGIVKGSVVEGDKPVSGVWIQFSEYVPTPGSSDGALTCTNRDFAVSDEHGRFEFPLVEAGKKFDLSSISTGGYTEAQCSGQVETGKILKVKPFSLMRLDKSVAGTVVDPDGNPVAGVSVSAEMRSGGHIPGAFLRQPTGQDGRFTIRGVPNLPLTLTAYIRPADDAKDRTIDSSARVDVEPGDTDVRIVFDPKLMRRKK
jgi:beta-lactamase regulating signal transducer with metallopeptidase domain/protocatechuate 3,4-dioxygenase beta subunit